MNCSYCGREVANLCVGRLGLLCVACHRDEMEQEDLLARRIAQPREPDPSGTFGGQHVTVPLASTSLLAWPRPPEAPQASPSDPARETVNPSPSSPESTQSKHRGRTAGVSKINAALTELTSRLSEGRTTAISDLARAVGCHPSNLKRSSRFMKSYRLLVDGMQRAFRKGSKMAATLKPKMMTVIFEVISRYHLSVSF